MSEMDKNKTVFEIACCTTKNVCDLQPFDTLMSNTFSMAEQALPSVWHSGENQTIDGHQVQKQPHSYVP